jgi:uncharacterized membrane protein
MAQQDVLNAADATSALPAIRTIGPADLKDALAKGLDDFRAMPSHAVFISLLYPLVGLILGGLSLGYDIVPLLFPLAAGFALLGPFAAIGLYEFSRRREQGLDTSWQHAFDVVHSPSFGAILGLGFILVVVFLVWLATAQAIYIAHFGYGPPPPPVEFLHQIFTTRNGWSLIVVGNGVGFLFAVLAFTVTAVSFPMLLDRNVSAAVAALTSLRVVLRNPATMALWGLIVAIALAIGSIPFLLGLAVVMPVLGHATWHLYRKAVEPDPNPRPEYQPVPKPPRYAAEFPAALFPWARQDRP